jgi:hypothetical protein
MHETNCVGYVYYEPGLTPEEKYHDCPTLSELLDKFDQVERRVAEAVAVVAPLEGEPTVIHMAVFNHGKNSIRHREGIDEPVTKASLFFGGLKSYLKYYEVNAELVYLAVKH